MHFNRLPILLAAAVGPFMVSAARERTGAENTACSAAVVEILPAVTAMPTPDQTLVDFIAEQTQLVTRTELCVVPAVTGSLAADYTSWASDVYSWEVEYKSEINNFLAKCSDAPNLKDQFDALPKSVCEEVTWISPSTTVVNAAPRETGLGLAAAAALGIAIVGAL